MRKITDEYSDYAKFHMSLKGYKFTLKGSRIYTFELYLRGFRDSYNLINGKTSYVPEMVENTYSYY